MKKVKINDEMSNLFHTKWNCTYHEANACPHIHIMVKIPPKLSVSKFMG